MKQYIQAGLASAAIVAAAIISTPAMAADLGSWGGSMKDGPMPMPAQSNCYVRGDIGYSWSVDPDATYLQNRFPEVRNADLDDAAFFEAGLGCGSAATGLRGDLMFGYHASKDFNGDIDIFITRPIDPPISTKIDSYTAMVNMYYDFGNFGGVTPYVGGGIGVAYHDMDMVIVDHPLSPNPQYGADKVNFAWALMAGVGYQLSERTTLDVGYRYIDMGKAVSDHGDVALAWNPQLEVDDIVEHEFKVGIRYGFDSLF